MSQTLLNYAFLLFWCFFGEILRELLFLDIKVTISETSTEILRKFVFLTTFEKGKILRKIWICLNIFFDQTSKRGHILIKNFFLSQLSHIQLNYVILLFWSIFGEIHRESFFLVKKVTISETNIEIPRKLFYLPYL